MNYKLVLNCIEGDYTVYDIIEESTGEPIKEVYREGYKSLMRCGGAVGLLKLRGEGGSQQYCKLFFTYTEYSTEDQVTITFDSAYTKDEEPIFIRCAQERIGCVLRVKGEKVQLLW